MTNCQLEKCLNIVNMEKNLSCVEISPHEKCEDKLDLSQFMMFCRKICFVTVYVVLSRFTRFCMQKNLTKNCVCGEKGANIRYARAFCLSEHVAGVWSHGTPCGEIQNSASFQTVNETNDSD